jgi:hypothetical protein
MIAGIVATVVVAGLIVFTRIHDRRTGKPAAAPGSTTVYAVDAWLDSCLGGCRRTAQRMLANVSPEKRERYCTVNCECGMEKMTEPGPQPRTVRAPSHHWKNLGEDKQYESAAECQKRSKEAIGQ